MQVTALVENTASRPDLISEHGLSLLIETGGRRILFDFGQTDAFASNAGKMGIDLASVDLAVLSHGHYDHGGGLRRFLELNQDAPVYVNPKAFEPHYNGTEKYIGLDPSLSESDRLQRVEEIFSPAPGLTLFPGAALPLPYPAPAYGLNRKQGDSFFPDDFLHEQYLLVEEGGKQILFSGCSHRGILNIADHFRPDVLIGGFHFKKLDPDGDGRPVLSDAAERLLALPCSYVTCHCTGQAQYAFLRQRMGRRLSCLRTGDSMVI